MSVTLELVVEEKKQALSVPLAAVSGKYDHKVKVLDEKEQIRGVKLGGVYGEFVEIISGMSDQDVIKVPVFVNPDDELKDTPFMKK
jgi:multidrug efflux pump subunit AcrA (membrane-fusion protein)